MANRLSEDPDATVLLLEAGGWDRDPWIHIPLGWGRILERRLHDWMYFIEPEANANGRRIECARGKVIGGSSSINAMAYVRGNRADYDRWAAGGLDNWSYAHVLPYFRRQETWEGGANQYRGGDGPLTVGTARYDDPIIDACLAAGAALQLPLTDDYNGAQQEGLGRMQQTIRRGRRCSAAEAYLRPALTRSNLTVETGALAHRVVLDRGRAIGVEYQRGGDTSVARAEREVILSRRRHQLAAAIDAVRHRRPGSAGQARDRSRGAAHRGRPKPAGPSVGAGGLRAPRAGPVCRDDAA